MLHGMQHVPATVATSYLSDDAGSDHGEHAHVANLRSEADLWRELVARLQIAPSALASASTAARRNGTTTAAELVAARVMSEEAYCRTLSALLGLGFMEKIQPALLVMRRAARLEALCRPGEPAPAFYYSHEVPLVLIAPLYTAPQVLLRRLSGTSDLRARFRIVTSSELRSAIQARSSAALMHTAVNGLAEAVPVQSARTVLTGRQGFVLGLALSSVTVLAAFDFSALALAIHLVGTLAFLACVIVRAWAATMVKPLRLTRLSADENARLPVYSVLVALRNEAEIVPELLVALGKIDWPRAKLEIKLICEADDPGTRAALAAHDLHPSVEILVVPAASPRTKPKALAFALPQCKGDFVVLYDAEDRPHPQQLREAWEEFGRQGPDLACLQAPLVVSRSRHLLPGLFALEYAALFRGLLPCLAAARALVPLGGTSNHFRRDALEAVGGWDPYNVTEDADLGLRLTRHGYRVAMITRPTYETAPADYETWLPQRTRWFKGWMQTWLVHIRSPRALWRDLGAVNFALMQVLFAGMVVSALAHVFFVITLIALVTTYLIKGALPSNHAAIFAVDIFNVVAGYGAFLLLGYRALSPAERPGFWKLALATPFYWLALSHGAWRALWHLVRRPHHWEKTPHPPARRISAAGELVPDSRR